MLPHHEPGLPGRGLGVGDAEEDGDLGLDLVHVGDAGPVVLGSPGPVVQVHVEPVDAAVVGVDGDVPRQVLAARPALALQLGQPPAQNPGGGRVVGVVPVGRVYCFYRVAAKSLTQEME